MYTVQALSKFHDLCAIIHDFVNFSSVPMISVLFLFAVICNKGGKILEKV